MPAVPTYRAIATKASVATLFAMAEADGEASVYLETEHACMVLRRRCYAHRSQLRKHNMALTGMGVSAYDSYTFPWQYCENLGKWKFTVTANELIEFELIVPEDTLFDISRFEFIQDSDVPQVNLDRLERAFESSVHDWSEESLSLLEPLTQPE